MTGGFARTCTIAGDGASVHSRIHPSAHSPIHRGTSMVPATESCGPRDGRSAAHTAPATKVPNRTNDRTRSTGCRTWYDWLVNVTLLRDTPKANPATGSQATIARHAARHREAGAPRR